MSVLAYRVGYDQFILLSVSQYIYLLKYFWKYGPTSLFELSFLIDQVVPVRCVGIDVSPIRSVGTYLGTATDHNGTNE